MSGTLREVPYSVAQYPRRCYCRARCLMSGQPIPPGTSKAATLGSAQGGGSGWINEVPDGLVFPPATAWCVRTYLRSSETYAGNLFVSATVAALQRLRQQLD